MAEEKVIDKIAERKAKEIKAGFLNPFGEKTSYTEFIEEVKKSKGSIAEYCKRHLTKEEIECLEIEIEHYNTNNKKD